MIDVVPFLPFVAGDAADALVTSHAKIMISRLRARKAESADEIRSQLLYLSEALKSIRQMSQEQIAELVEKLEPAAKDRDRDRFKHEYGVLLAHQASHALFKAHSTLFTQVTVNSWTAANALAVFEGAFDARHQRFIGQGAL